MIRYVKATLSAAFLSQFSKSMAIDDVGQITVQVPIANVNDSSVPGIAAMLTAEDPIKKAKTTLVRKVCGRFSIAPYPFSNLFLYYPGCGKTS
jgi:hypothetical protein